MTGGKFGDEDGVSNDGRILIPLNWVIPSNAPVCPGIFSHLGCYNSQMLILRFKITNLPSSAQIVDHIQKCTSVQAPERPLVGFTQALSRREGNGKDVIDSQPV